MKKRFLMLTLCVLLALVSVLALASCDDDDDVHTHAYTDTVIPATCTTGGYTTHTCSCGHSYTDTQTPVAPHATTTKILRYPTTLVKGKQVVSCSNCSYSVTEDINVITSFAMPGIADTLASILPQGSFVIDDCDSLPTISISNFLSKELSDDALLGSLTPSTSLKESNYALQLKNVAFSVEGDTVTGTIAFDLLTYLEGSDTPTPIFSLAFYLVGEDVSVAINNEAPANFKLSDKIYETIASMMDMTVEELKEVFYLASTAKDYLPLVESIANAFAGELSKLEQIDISGLMTVLSLIGKDIVQTEVVGANTVYTVQLGAAIEALSTYEDKTIANILDDCFGAGTAASLTGFLAKLPDMTIGDIADAAIALSENYDIDLNRIYAIINGVVYNATGEDFDFETELYKQYDKTLLSVLMGDAAQNAEQVKSALIGAANALTTYTLSDWVHLTSCTKSSEVNHSMEDCVLLSAMLDSIATNLNESIVAEITVDAEGNVVAFNTALAPFLAVSKTENDIITFSLALPEHPATTFVLDLSVENQMKATLTVDGVELATATFAPGEGNCMWVANLTVKVPQTQLDTETSYTTLTYTLTATSDELTGNVTLSLVGEGANATIILDENGMPLTFDISIFFLTATKTESGIITVTISLPEEPVICLTIDLSKADEKTAILTVGGDPRAVLTFIPGKNSRTFSIRLIMSIPTPATDDPEAELIFKEYGLMFEAFYDPDNDRSSYTLHGVFDGHQAAFGIDFTPNYFFARYLTNEDCDISLLLAKNPDASEVTIQFACKSKGEEPFDNLDLSLVLAKTANGFEVTLIDNLGNTNLLEVIYVADAETGNASLSIAGMLNYTLTKTVENGVTTYTLVNTATEATLVSVAMGAGAIEFTFGFDGVLTGGLALTSTTESGSLQFSVECKDLTITLTNNYKEDISIDQALPSLKDLYYDVTEINTYVLDGILSFTITPATAN